jgi:hypothetical protein
MSPETRERLLAVEIRAEQIPILRRENKELRLALATGQQAQDERICLAERAIDALTKRIQELEAERDMRREIPKLGLGD